MKYDEILMGDEASAIEFLTKECGMETVSALKLLKQYHLKKRAELQALSMETDPTVAEDDLKLLTEAIDQMLSERKNSAKK